MALAPVFVEAASRRRRTRSPSSGSRSIRAVIRASSGSPRPSPRRAYAPGQSIAAQTISGRTSLRDPRRRDERHRGPARARRGSRGRLSPDGCHRRSTRRTRGAPIPQPVAAASAASAKVGGTGGATAGSPRRASATRASPSRSSTRSPSRVTVSGRSSGGGSRSVTSTPCAASPCARPPARAAPPRSRRSPRCAALGSGGRS